jgi:hypothetical protein
MKKKTNLLTPNHTIEDLQKPCELLEKQKAELEAKLEREKSELEAKLKWLEEHFDRMDLIFWQ